MAKSINELLYKIDYTNWASARKDLNKFHGFFEADSKVEEINSKLNYCIYAAEKSFIGLSFQKKESEKKEIIVSFEMETKFYNKREHLVYKINEINYSTTSVDFYFNCKFCGSTTKVEGNPKRGVSGYFDSFLCKNCKNSIIHKCDDYKIKFKKAMNEKYGVETATPFKVPQVRKQIVETMTQRYGVPYSGLSPELLRKSWAKWDSKCVASNFEKSVSFFLKEQLGLNVHDSSNPYIITVNKKTFIPDIVIPELKLIIECFGDYWHGNPELFKEDQIIANGKFSRKECNDKDEKRIQTIEKETGFKIKIVWENSWKTNRAKTEEEIRKIIDERISFLSTQQTDGCQSQ